MKKETIFKLWFSCEKPVEVRVLFKSFFIVTSGSSVKNVTSKDFSSDLSVIKTGDLAGFYCSLHEPRSVTGFYSSANSEAFSFNLDRKRGSARAGFFFFFLIKLCLKIANVRRKKGAGLPKNASSYQRAQSA